MGPLPTPMLVAVYITTALDITRHGQHLKASSECRGRWLLTMVEARGHWSELPGSEIGGVVHSLPFSHACKLKGHLGRVGLLEQPRHYRAKLQLRVNPRHLASLLHVSLPSAEEHSIEDVPKRHCRNQIPRLERYY